MSHSRIVVRGLFFKDVDASFKLDVANGLSISAKERLFRDPICEVKIGDKSIFRGKINALEEALKGKLPPRLAAAIEFDSFLGEVAREVGHYHTFKTFDPIAGLTSRPAAPIPTVFGGVVPDNCMFSVAGGDATMVVTSAPVHYMSATQILAEIRANHSAYAVMTVPEGTESTAWGRRVVSNEGFSIVAGKLNPKFPFEKGTVEDNNQFTDQIFSPYNGTTKPSSCPDEMFGAISNNRVHILALKANQQGVAQTKIYIYIGDYLDSFGRPSVATFVFNTKAELFDSISNAVKIEGNGYVTPDEAIELTKGLLSLSKQLFPDVYSRTNCNNFETNLPWFVAGVHTPR